MPTRMMIVEFITPLFLHSLCRHPLMQGFVTLSKVASSSST